MPQIVTCPACDKKLQVPDDLIGKNVQCPECKKPFLASMSSGISASAPAPTPPPPASARIDDDEDMPKRRRRTDDDDDDDFDEPRGRVRRLRANTDGHRGPMILTMGILSLLVCQPVLGPIAWVMGGNDLREMRDGRMDPEGEGLTQAGRIMGMIATIMSCVAAVGTCLYFVFIFLCCGIFAGMANQQQRRMPQRRN